MFGSGGKKLTNASSNCAALNRVREICSLGRMNDDRPDLEVFQQCRAFRPRSKREPIACYNLVLNSVRIIAREGSKRSATSNTAIDLHCE
jgi:hypothetical protein